MPYHLENTQLRVVHKYVRKPRNATALSGARLLLLEHVLPTTEEFVYHLLGSGAEVFALVAKPYSIDEASLARLRARGVRVLCHSYAALETETILDDLLAEAVARSQSDKKPIVVAEVGGYFANALSRVSPDAAQYIAGVVEDTTFGHNRYVALKDQIPVPIFSVARSPLKEIEARFVGRDAVAAVEHVLRGLGVTIAGRNALVIGYGMIGANVARALRSLDLNVQVYDKHDYKNLRAFIDGFYIHKKRKLLENADLIFSATADRGLTLEEIEECKSNVVLASVGSKDTEFDVAGLKEQANKTEKIGPHVVKYSIANSKNIMLVRDGTAVNFLLPSLPVEILDLVFSEILIAVMLLLKRQREYPPGKVWEVETALDSISKDWLRFVNSS